MSAGPIISFVTTVELRDAVDQLARRAGVSRSAMLEEIIRTQLESSGFSVKTITQEERSAKKQASLIQGRLLKAMRDELDAILRDR